MVRHKTAQWIIKRVRKGQIQSRIRQTGMFPKINNMTKQKTKNMMKQKIKNMMKQKTKNTMRQTMTFLQTVRALCIHWMEIPAMYLAARKTSYGLS